MPLPDGTTCGPARDGCQGGRRCRCRNHRQDARDRRGELALQCFEAPLQRSFRSCSSPRERAWSGRPSTRVRRSPRCAGRFLRPRSMIALRAIWCSQARKFPPWNCGSGGPHPLPDVLVQIVAVAGVDARREKGQKQRSMPAVEHFERISGRAKSPLRRIAAGNLGGQLLIAPGRLVHDGCHELRVCETRARQSRGKVFRPSASTVDNHGQAQRTDGNDPSKCVLVDIIMMVSFSWKTAVTIRPHSHWRTNHTAISSQEATRSSGTTTCVRLARALVQPGAVCAFAVLEPSIPHSNSLQMWSGSRHLWRSRTGRSDERDDNDQAKPRDRGFDRR